MKKELDAILFSLKTVFSVSPFTALIVIAAQVFLGIIPSFTTLVTANLIDSITIQEFDKTILLAVYLVALYAARYITDFLFSAALNVGVYEKVTAHVRVRLCEKSARLKFSDYEDAEKMDRKKRASDAVESGKISTVFNASLAAVSSGISIISLSAVLGSYDLRLPVLSIISVCPYFFMLILRGMEFYKIHWAQASRQRMTDYLWHLFVDKSSVKEMRVMNFDGYISDKWRLIRGELNDEIFDQNTREVKSVLLCDIIKTVGYSVSILLTIWLVYRGNITIGVFGACIGAFSTVQENMRQFLVRIASFPLNCLKVADFVSFMELPEEENGSIELSTLKDGMFVKNVTFSYPNQKMNAVDGISLEILPGEILTLVGENGSGKTTLSRVIMGVYAAKEGVVEYDGIPIEKIDKKKFKISIVPQNFSEYKFTFGESIALSDVIDEERIQMLSKEMGLESLCENGLDTQMGKEFGGAELSKGQAQRIAIARGIYHESELIVLDEPTAALDPIAETEILKEFIRTAKNRTAVIITHRVGICRYSDKIAVLDKGRIIEMGTHDELIERKGKYFEMYEAQSKWYV